MSLDGLLRVQELDNTIQQLQHRRGSLSERDQLDELAADQGEIDAERIGIDGERDGLLKEQRRLEDEVAMIETKSAEEQAKLYQGGVTSPKEAQALQDEIASLQRHQNSLEDRILTLMEQVEPLTQSRDGLDERTDQADRRVSELRATIAAHEADIDGALTAAEIERAGAADSIDPDHLARYEQIQAGFGGVAVVSFVGRNCAGCPLSMPAVEADRVRKAAVGTLIDCQECGRLVVR